MGSIKFHIKFYTFSVEYNFMHLSIMHTKTTKKEKKTMTELGIEKQLVYFLFHTHVHYLHLILSRLPTFSLFLLEGGDYLIVPAAQLA